MYIEQWIGSRRTAFVGILRRWISYKTVGISLLALAFTLFGDVIMLAIGSGLHLLVEVVEITLEHALEHVFGLTPRQAQFVLAYSALVLGAYLLVYLSRKAYLASVRVWLATKTLGLRTAEWAKTASHNPNWYTLATTLFAIGATIYLFT